MNDEPKTGILQFAAPRPAGPEAKEGEGTKPALVSERKEYRAALEWLAGERERGQGGALLVPYGGQGGEEIIAYSQFMSAHRDGTSGYFCLHFSIGSIEV